MINPSISSLSLSTVTCGVNLSWEVVVPSSMVWTLKLLNIIQSVLE
jgi:hypothetical protein